VAWPLAQFSSCTCPTDAGRAILDSYRRFLGVSHGGCIRVYLGNFAKLNPLGTVGVACFMGRLTVGATNRGVSAGWTLLANRKSARVLLGLVGFCTDCTARVVSAQCHWVTVSLALTVLGASSVRNVVIQLALTVANDEVLTANLSLLDVAYERHDNRGVCLVFSSISRYEPSRGLALYQLWVIGRDTL
jgi:hypothetical protein